MENMKELLKILKTDFNWTEQELIEKFNITKKELFELLILVIEKEIKNLDFDPNLDRYKYLYKVFKYFDSLEDDSIILFVIRRLKRLSEYCNLKVNKAIKNGVDTAFFDNVIYKIIDIINVTLLKLEFVHKTVNEEDINSRNYKFLYELIYNIKNYDYVFEIFKTSSKLMYTITPGKELLFDELINHYIEIVITGENHYDIIYFEKIIKMFLNSKKFIVDKSHLKQLINKLLLSIDNLKRKKIKSHEIKRIEFFLNEVINDLRNNNINDFTDLNYKYGIIDGFSSEILLETKNTCVLDDTMYLDLRKKFVITIDCPKTKTFDDACLFEQLEDGRFLLGIFVSDVDVFFKMDSLLDNEAFKRAESIYLKDHQITMLPYEFSNIASLNKGDNRYTIGYFFTFDSQMNLTEFYVKRAIINVKYNLDYYDVSKALNNCYDIKLFNTLKDMIKATEKLAEMHVYNEQYKTVKEIKRGIVNIDNSKFKNGESSIFSTFIVLMNHYIANYFNMHPEIPFPYHVNLSRYDDYIIKDLKMKIVNNDNFESILSHLNEIYIPSFYSTENLGHNGLNLASYSNASNPLRQYISLVTERLVKHHMIDLKEEPLINLNDMNKICEYINNRQKVNFEYEQEYIKLLKKKKY